MPGDEHDRNERTKERHQSIGARDEGAFGGEQEHTVSGSGQVGKMLQHQVSPREQLAASLRK
jgi:hypothetical protein